MAFVLERENRSGSFELGRFRFFSEALGKMVDYQRAGDEDTYRITSDVTGELVYRVQAFSPEVVVLPGFSEAGAARLSQNVQVKSSVESHFETVVSGGKGGSGVRFSGFGPLALRDDRASDPTGVGQVTRAAGNAVEPASASGPAFDFDLQGVE